MAKPIHDPVSEKRRHSAEGAFTFFDHAVRELQHGIGEALVHRPLDRGAFGQALVVVHDRLHVPGHHPRRNVIVEKLCELVLLRGVVVGIHHGAHQKEHEPPGWHGDRHQKHAVDEHEVCPRQAERAPHETEKDVDDVDGEEKEDGALRRRVEPHAKVLEGKPVRSRQPDGQTHGRTDQQSLEGKGRTSHFNSLGAGLT